MSKARIIWAEKRVMEHLRRGGSILDPVGIDYVTRFIDAACQDPTVSEIITDHKVTVMELMLMYTVVINVLMPNPCINAGGPLLVPTLFFTEPHRLRSLLIDLDRDYEDVSIKSRGELLAEKAIEMATTVQRAHDTARGPVDFQIIQAGGFRPASQGCLASILLMMGLMVIWVVTCVASTG